MKAAVTLGFALAASSLVASLATSSCATPRSPIDTHEVTLAPAPAPASASAPAPAPVVASDSREADAGPLPGEPTAGEGGAQLAANTATAIAVEGKPVDDSGLVDVRALELACLADARALTDTKNVWARFDDVAGKQLVPVGELAFVLLERDPARSLTDPPPLLCRTIASSTVLRAPLVRAREPAARWLVKRIDAGVVPDTAALVRQSALQKLELSARPRVIVDDAGALVAIAVPVAVAGARGGE